MSIRSSFVAAVAAVVFSAAIQSVEASPVVIGVPVGTADADGNIGARIRWGGTGWEAAIRRGGVTNQVYSQLNPTGNPFWVVGTPYKFETSWAWDTGIFGLGVDFNGDNTFGPGEYVTQTFDGSGVTGPSRVGYGYYGFRIFGNQATSVATSQITGLSITGTPLPDIVLPANSSLTTEYANFNQVLGDGNTTLDANTWAGLIVTGSITFTSAGTGSERPAWDFSLLNPTPVPEPSTAAMGMAGIACVVWGAYRRRRRI